MPIQRAKGREAKKVVIFGLGDFARLAAFYFEQDSSFEVVGFTANESYIDRSEWMGKPVLPFERLEQEFSPQEVALFVAIGFKRINRARAEVCAAGKAKGYQLASYLSSTSIDSAARELGENCFILENVVIQPFVTIGRDVVVWAGSHIGHDSTIGDHVFIAPAVAISGNVKVGPYSFVGINATLRDGISIGEGCVIGAGAIILQDLPAGTVCAGIAAEAKALQDRLPKGF